MDIIEFERKETTLRYIEQSALVVSTSSSTEMAKKLLDILKNEYFIGLKDSESKKTSIAAQALLEIQKYAFVAAPGSGGSSILEMRKKNGA